MENQNKNNGETLHTVKDLIEYLSTLDQDKYIEGEYFQIFLGEHVGYKYRPLLKSLITLEGDHYKFGPMIY